VVRRRRRRDAFTRGVEARQTDHLPRLVVDGPLTPAYNTYIHMHMRTTLILDDALLERARRLTGIAEKTALVHAGLEALIARAAARRLAALGGTMPRARAAPRRRSKGRAR